MPGRLAQGPVPGGATKGPVLGGVWDAAPGGARAEEAEADAVRGPEADRPAAAPAAPRNLKPTGNNPGISRVPNMRKRQRPVANNV